MINTSAPSFPVNRGVPLERGGELDPPDILAMHHIMSRPFQPALRRTLVVGYFDFLDNRKSRGISTTTATANARTPGVKYTPANRKEYRLPYANSQRKAALALTEKSTASQIFLDELIDETILLPHASLAKRGDARIFTILKREPGYLGTKRVCGSSRLTKYPRCPYLTLE